MDADMRPSTERLTCPGRGAWGRMLWIGAALFAAGAAQASLQGRDVDGNAANGFEAYYDNVLGITWLADANHAYSSGQAAGSFGAMTWTASHLSTIYGFLSTMFHMDCRAHIIFKSRL